MAPTARNIRELIAWQLATERPFAPFAPSAPSPGARYNVGVFPMFLVFAFLLTGGLPGGEPVTTKHLTIATSTAQASVAPGDRVALNIDIAPKPTMHVYAPGQKDYIPVSITIDGGPAVKATAIQFPTPEKREVKELGETQLVYSRPFRIVQQIAVAKAPGGKPGPLTVKGAVKYQACDDSICYAPITVPVSWTLTVKKPSAR